MGRPFAELLRDLEEHPELWEVVRVDTVPSVNRRNRGGTSVQELMRHKTTGEELCVIRYSEQTGRLSPKPTTGPPGNRHHEHVAHKPRPGQDCLGDP